MSRIYQGVLIAALLAGIWSLSWAWSLLKRLNCDVPQMYLPSNISGKHMGNATTARYTGSPKFHDVGNKGKPHEAAFTPGVSRAKSTNGQQSFQVVPRNKKDHLLKDNGFPNRSNTQLFGQQGRSWCACAACMEVHDPLSYVCIGSDDGLQRVKELSGRFKGSCDACKACPRCESCNVTVTPLGFHLGSARSSGNGMRLAEMVDSAGVHFVAKVTGHPPGHKVAALERIVRGCGFQDIVPRERKGPLHAKVQSASSDGILTASTAIFSEMKPGHWVQLPERTQEVILQVNKTQIVRAAWFTFLFQAADSMRKNVLYSPDSGSMYVIDNLEHGLCPDCRAIPGSIFYPANFRYYEIEASNPLSVYNYQDFIADSKMASDYPGELRWCLTDLATLPLHSLHLKYEMPSTLDAERIQERAKWMLEGFEVAIWRHFCKYYATSGQEHRFIKELKRKWNKKQVQNLTAFLIIAKNTYCNN